MPCFDSAFLVRRVVVQSAVAETPFITRRGKVSEGASQLGDDTKRRYRVGGQCAWTAAAVAKRRETDSFIVGGFIEGGVLGAWCEVIKRAYCRESVMLCRVESEQLCA